MDTKIYKRILDAGVITEREVNTMKNRANKGFASDVRQILSNGPLRITPEQTKKGIDWLINQWKTPKGKTRKHNPFNQREQVILSHFDHFELRTFIDVGGFFNYWYLPVYRAYSKKGMYFDYFVEYAKRNPITILR